VFKLAFSRKDVISSIFLVSSDEIRIVDGWEWDK
jgi:hypothetical protein